MRLRNRDFLTAEEPAPPDGPERAGAARHMLRAAMVSYGLLVPALIALAQDIFTVPAGLVAFVAHWIPMVDRVTAYGHPSPELLQAFLTLGWAIVPILVLVQHGSHDRLARPVSAGTGLVHAISRYTAVLALSFGLLFFIWYWPNFSLAEFSAPLGNWADERRGIFRSNWGLAFAAPIWFAFAAGLLEVVRSETHAFRRIWRSGYWR